VRRKRMKREKAEREVIKFLAKESEKHKQGHLTPRVEYWPNENDVRVAEVSFASNSAGFAFMQSDVPHGIAVCALVERLVLDLIDEESLLDADDELDGDKWRLACAIWSEEAK
jgi:hypothetical protein